MKRLEDIKNEIAKKHHYGYWIDLVSQNDVFTIDRYHNEAMKLYAREVAQASLQKAAENALIDGSEFSRCGCEIDEQSIVNPDNIVLL